MWITIVIFFMLYLIDQLSKYLSQLFLTADTVNTFIPNVISLRLTYNTGAAFSSFDGASWLLILISLAATIALGYFLTKNNWKHEKYRSFLVTMITAGCVGNLFDRIIMVIPGLNGTDGRYGVVDMIQFDFLNNIWNAIFKSNFAICNIADVYLVVGLILFAIDYIFFADRRKKKYEAQNN